MLLLRLLGGALVERSSSTRDFGLLFQGIDLFLVGLLQLFDAGLALSLGLLLELRAVLVKHGIGFLVRGEEAHIVDLGPAALVASERRRDGPGGAAQNRRRVVDGDHVEVGPALHQLGVVGEVDD